MPTKITPIIAQSNTEEVMDETDSSPTTFRDSDTVISGSSLTSGDDYILLYSIAARSTDPTGFPGYEARVTQGSTVLAYMVGRGRPGVPSSYNSMNGSNLPGAVKITADGNDIAIEWRAEKELFAGDDILIHGKCLIAIPLASLKSGIDYFYSAVDSNGNTPEITTTGTATTLITYSPTLPDAGNYLVIASAEANPPALSDDAKIKFQIDGTTQKTTWVKNRHFPTNYYGFCYVDMHYFSSNPTLRLQCSGSGTGTKEFRRGRVLLVRCASFQHFVNNRRYKDDNSAEKYSSWGDLMQRQYTPDDTDNGQYVILMANTFCEWGGASQSGGIRIENSTDGTYFADRTYDKAIASNDVGVITAFGAETISTAKTYLINGTKDGALSPTFTDSYTSFILWGLTKTRTLIVSDSTVDVKYGTDVTAGWPLSTNYGSGNHYEQVDPDNTPVTDTFIACRAATKTDAMKLLASAIPDDLEITQKISLVFRYSGAEELFSPGVTTTAYLSGGETFTEISQSFDTLGIVTAGVIELADGEALQLTRAELESLVDQRVSFDASGETPPDPIES